MLAPEDILLTHGISQEAFFQSSANAYFCGDTHRARQFKTALNTGYLHNDKGFNGTYFTATLDDDEWEVAVHGLDEQWKGCQFSSIAFIAFEKATSEEEENASIDDLVVAARDGVVDDETFADQFRSYLEELANVDRPHPTDPVNPVES